MANSKRNTKNVNTSTIFLDRDDVDNAILEYIHKVDPATEGMDITEWEFRRGEVKVTFDLDTYENLGTVSARDHNEALDEIESLLDENERLQSEIETLDDDRIDLADENESLHEELVEKDEYIRKLEKRLERALNDLEDATDNGCYDGPRRPHHLF